MNKAFCRPVLSRLAMPLLVFLAACNMGGNADGSSEQGDLVGARIGGPFTLTDQDGAPRRWDDFAGRYRIVYFGYTYCPDVCPIDLQRIMQGFSQFEKAQPALAAKVAPMLISVDPDRDTPAVLKSYAAAFHPRLIALTGAPDQIKRVARDFAVVYGKEPATADGGYAVAHTRTPYLFGPDGKPIALVPVDDPATPDVDEGAPEAVLAFLEQWIK